MKVMYAGFTSGDFQSIIKVNSKWRFSMFGAFLELTVGTVMVFIPDPLTTGAGAAMIADACSRIADDD